MKEPYAERLPLLQHLRGGRSILEIIKLLLSEQPIKQNQKHDKDDAHDPAHDFPPFGHTFSIIRRRQRADGQRPGIRMRADAPEWRLP